MYSISQRKSYIFPQCSGYLEIFYFLTVGRRSIDLTISHYFKLRTRLTWRDLETMVSLLGMCFMEQKHVLVCTLLKVA